MAEEPAKSSNPKLPHGRPNAPVEPDRSPQPSPQDFADKGMGAGAKE